MDVDWGELAGQFARAALTIEGVYRTALEPGVYGGHSRAHPTPHSGFVFALQGSAAFAFDGVSCELSPGKIVHGAKDAELTLTVGAAGFEYVLVHYSLAGTGAEPEPYAHKHFLIDAGTRPPAVEPLLKLHEAARRPDAFSALKSRELFYAVLHEALTGARQRSHGAENDAVERAISHIHERYAEPLTLASLAERHGIKPKRFAYLFRQYAGLYPIDYLIRHRIERAKELLASQSLAVSEVAESVGYADAHYFSRLFRRHTGRSPSSFRDKSGNRPPGI
ncbi:helix-turn-helix domain-containing protein [Cohnella zeiphila]|uniref:Helix-turn-helix transcriptional regulator n=1 Tax=Cohnella zeiphila TaxID=2761120 RepID=A0A7X0SLI3_9BACL|nr:AraC family transcriptional regulator [Cohnella zeiphila]MBB6731039.1 helix-turn-helix transcriptional regulator [Cohnella zeiphila]